VGWIQLGWARQEMHIEFC